MKKLKRIFAVFFCLLLAAGILGGCGKAASSSAPAPSALQSGNKPLKIVTTIFPEYDWVREILGDKADHAEVTMLLGNGVDLHSYQPTADDIIKISDCDLFLYVGGESDGWVEDALKEATNKNMKVINLLDVLKDTVKTEEAMPGMQTEEGHHHGYSHFADSDVQDRSLSDWDGEWQSVYPYLQEGILDEVMERKAENGNKTAEEYRAYYETGYKTDVFKITINAENNTMCFVKNGVEATAAYQYKGYQIYDYESGSRGVRYFFEATDGDADAPKYVQFSDHGIAPGKAEHFHIYFGNEGFDALSQEMENWPTYYPMDMSGDEIKEDMLEHAEKEYDEHVWLSLKNAETLCNAITDTLEEIARVKNLKELQNILFAVPAESFLYHISRNHVSRWLYSRAMFPIGEFLKPITWNSLQDVDAHRKIIFEAIVKYRKMKNQGVVAVFKRDRFDRYSNFARIGDGSLGGKGRGLAFIDNMVKHHPEFDEFENARVAIPKTVVLCTDVFDEFMETNNLYQIALSDADDDVILRYFLKAKLPDRLVEDFFTFFDVVKSPIAIRSSSLLEDSHYQPFAGIYNTYMIPYLDDKYEMLRMLSDAIKGVYASVYFRDSKAYMQATSNVIDQEKMAVILQEVVGNQYGDRYYPSMSGVARSLNYYPIGDEKAEEGIVNLALGLGKYIVDGGMTLRFSPYHPNQVLQTSEMEIALKETQTRFYALDLRNAGHDFSIDDGFNLLKLHVKEAEKSVHSRKNMI